MREPVYQAIFNIESNLETPTIEIDGEPKKRGRPSQCLTASELKEAVGYYFSSVPSIRKRLLAKYGALKIKRALAIAQLDMGKQGAVGRVKCALHGKTHLVYRWENGSERGIRIKCTYQNCGWTSHYLADLYHSEEGMIINGQTERSDGE